MLRKLFWTFFVLALLGVLGGGAVAWIAYEHYSQDLPEIEQLARYEPPTVTRVHAGDGRLLAEFAKEKRVFVPIEAIPRRVVRAFLSAEDKTFYEHAGIDLPGVVRAVVTNLQNLGSDRRPVGASTITQQVAKNFLLTNEVSIERKIKEALIAFRIEKAFSKDEILELYLNEIYLGFRSYGVAAAALNYFNKSLDELTVAEAAYLAALPKAPNNYHPVRDKEAAIARRNWVIDRMTEDGHITPAEAAEAKAEPLQVQTRDDTEFVQADYFTEEVRRELIDVYGEDQLYGGGLSVRTTLDPALQKIAERALREGLLDYDRRHGWRGPVATLDLDTAASWQEALATVERPEGVAPWLMAVVLEVGSERVAIGLEDGSEGKIPFEAMKWARPWLEDQRVGASPNRPADVLERGDVVMVEALPEEEGRDFAAYSLQQPPAIEGALMALDPHTGRILAMSGGFSYARSQFNRATQAKRQPGSSFKPIVYLAALDDGLTPSTIVLDAPFVIDQGAGLGKWKPSNYSNQFYGPTPMRIGIEKSRNLMTVRLAQTIGMEKVEEFAKKLNVVDDMQPLLSSALGSLETTLQRMTTAYAMLVNGGKRIQPSVIDRVQDRHGVTIYRHDTRDCPNCLAEDWHEQRVPELPDDRPQVADPRNAYQVVSMLEGVVQRGTGRRIAEIGKPLAGKTGTTNDSFDTWFVGFSPDLAVGVFVGFDEPRTLGPRETGSSVAAPIFKDFMAEALKDAPATPFRVPPGIALVRVDPDTGKPAAPGASNTILEAFIPGTVPRGDEAVIDAQTSYGQPSYSQGSQPTGYGAPSQSPAPSSIGSGLY